MTYKPLPENLIIKQSPIEGLGLFALEDIEAGHTLGLSHLKIEGELIRTPLGGFYNHSENPNCEKEKKPSRNLWNLVTTKPIKAGDEITVEYTFYRLPQSCNVKPGVQPGVQPGNQENSCITI